MNLFVEFSVFGMGDFSLLTAPKIASRRLEGVSCDLNNGTLVKSTFYCDVNGDDSLFKEFYKSSSVYKHEDSIWNNFIENKKIS